MDGKPQRRGLGYSAGENNGMEKWDCSVRGIPNATRNVALWEIPKYFASGFS